MSITLRLTCCSILSISFIAVPGCGEGERPAELELPGDAFFPESVTVDAEGGLYAGSITTGQIVRFAPGSSTAEEFVSGDDFAGATGLLVDSARDVLYVCAVDIDQLLGGEAPTSELRVYDLTTAELTARFELDGVSFCNDHTVDNDGNLYVADSLGRIHRLEAGGAALTVWSDDPQLAPTTPGGFGADGIAWDGDRAIYVNTFTDGLLLRVPIQVDGTAGPVEQIAVTPALSSPDGMRMLDTDALVVVNGSGSVVRVDIADDTAVSSLLRDGLDQPTSVAVFDDEMWVSEGQIGILFGLVEGPPVTPFRLLDIAAE